MIWFFVVVYLAIGAVYTSVVGKGDGRVPHRAEVGMAGGILAGVCWPFAIVYVSAYGRGLKDRATFGERGVKSDG